MAAIIQAPSSISQAQDKDLSKTFLLHLLVTQQPLYLVQVGQNNKYYRGSRVASHFWKKRM